LEQFAYIVSHNLRAPVANIIGTTKYLTSDMSEEEKIELMEGLHQSTLRLDTIVKDLNHILKVRSKEHEQKEMVHFSGLVNDVKLSLTDKIANTIINCDFTEVNELFAIKPYMYSIFYNLILNSIKFKKLDILPIIDIKSYQKDNKLILVFSDNGLGIDLNKHSEQIFGLYKRFHTHTAGKGIGLYMVKTQVESIGGTISVVSEINKGTEFTLEFNL
jgi:light-regulated signal transduction histidine kinase (bacteriophytochrome)